MRSVNLDGLGLKDTVLYEDGTIRCWNGRIITEPYASGQVQIPFPKGVSGTYNIALDRLVAVKFVPNPNAYTYIKHKDGDRQNCKAENLEWVEKRPRMSKKQLGVARAEAIMGYTLGSSKSAIKRDTGLSLPAINKIIHEFEASIRNAPKADV